MTPFTGCDTCWDFQLVYQLPCRWVWVSYKRRYIETAFIPCLACNVR